jgi:hypothetical protein
VKDLLAWARTSPAKEQCNEKAETEPLAAEIRQAYIPGRPTLSREGNPMVRTEPAIARATIAADCAAMISMLARNQAQWLRAHALPPQRITLARKTDGGHREDFWLVTDHTGADDAGFRVVYDDVSRQYGIECTILNGVNLFAGFRASLLDAVTDIKFAR